MRILTDTGERNVLGMDPKPDYSRKKGARSGNFKICAAEGCENEFYAYPSHIGHRYCSRPCMYRSRPPQPESVKKAKSERTRGTRTGTDNPSFKHGRRTGENLRGWSLVEKGDKTCRGCGAAAEDLHHAIPRSICTPEAKRDLRNGLPLCKGCHARWHRKSLVLGREVFTAEEWAYISGLKLTGRDTAGWLDKNYPRTRKDAA